MRIIYVCVDRRDLVLCTTSRMSFVGGYLAGWERGGGLSGAGAAQRAAHELMVAIGNYQLFTTLGVGTFGKVPR